jgi:hypothetical protein
VRRAFHLIILAFACAGCSGAPPDAYGWSVDGVLAPDEPWRGHDGPFLAQLVLTDDAKALYEIWNTKPGNVPMRPTVHAAPGTHVETVVLFVHCQPDRDGNCSVWGEATVEASDGRVLADGIEVPLWVDRPPPPGDALGISEHGIGLVVADFAGSYTFRVVVTDRVAGREVALAQELAVARTE